MRRSARVPASAPPNPHQSAPPSRRTAVLALGTTQTVAWGSSYYLPAILAEPMARDLGLATPWVFGAFSAALILSALLGPWAGRAIDRRGGRPVLAWSNVLLAVGLCLLAAAQGPATLAAGWMALGAGMSVGLYDAAFATLAGLYGREARGAITGITLIAGFASTVAWPLSAFCEAGIGWRGTCLVWAGMNLAFALPLNLLLVPRRDPPPGGIDAASAADAGTASAKPLPRFAAPLLAAAFAAVAFVAGAMAAHLPGVLRAAGADTAEAVLAAALIGPAQVAARLADFGLLRRAHPSVSARIAALCHPLGAAALLLFPGGVGAAAFALLHGAGNGVMTIARGALPLAVFGPAEYGARQGLIIAPARLLQASAPFFFGWLLDSTGVVAAVAVTSGLSFVALAALQALRRASIKHHL